MPTYRVLLVAYHFPPIAGSGVQRALKLAKYLPEHEVGVHVLTSGHEHYPLIDHSLLDEIASNPRIAIHRVSGFDPGSLANRMMPTWTRNAFGGAISAVEQRVYWRLQSAADRWAMPEPEQWWIGSALRAARRMHATRPFDAVITTSPPHSCQRVGIELQRTLGIPWIADLRDPIVDNFAYAPKNDDADRFWKTLERDVISQARAIVVTCPDYGDLLSRKYASSASRITCITNGFDEADRPAANCIENRGEFLLAHVGAFYQAQSIGPLLGACRSVLRDRDDARLRLRLVGSVSRQQEAHFQPGDEAFVDRAGYHNHAKALAEMSRADALFLMTPTNANGRNCIPAKLFEYLAFGRRVIGLVHRDSSVDALLYDAGARDIAYHDEGVAGLARCINAMLDDFISSRAGPILNVDVINRYRRDRLATHYADVIRSLIENLATAPASVGAIAT